MHLCDAIDAEEVAHHESTESPLVVQHIGQQVIVARTGNAIARVIAGHHRKRSCLNRLFEGRQEMLVQFHRTKHGLVTVLASFRSAIGNEVFQRGERGVRFREIATTDTTHHRSTQLTREHRVLAIRLFHSRPTGIA